MKTAADNGIMTIENNQIQMNTLPLEQILVEAQLQSSELAEKLLKVTATAQVDQSQLGYIGTIIDLYV